MVNWKIRKDKKYAGEEPDSAVVEEDGGEES